MSPINHFPNRVTIQIDGPSTCGLAVRLRFGMNAKNSFSYLVFLDSHGRAEVTGHELLAAFDDQRNAFLMDYGDPRIGFAGEVEAKVFDTDELKKAIDAFNIFRGKLSFPDNYEARLNNAFRRGQEPQSYQVRFVTFQ